ncbi:MAG: RrF2 family transcriptional regulator [Thermomicrobiales bacterium]
MKSSWFAVAVHAMALLSQSSEGYSSAFVAGSVNTNPAFLRRVLAVLGRANLVESREGRDGGYRLTRPADQITLAEVYRATSRGDTLLERPSDTSHLCPIGSGMPEAFAEIADTVERNVELELGVHTIADLANSALAHGIAG